MRAFSFPFTDDFQKQIIGVLKQHEQGRKVGDLCRELGISNATCCNWKAKYGGLGVPELRRLKQLEAENAQLKKLVADLSLDKQMLQDVIKKEALRPVQKRGLAKGMVADYLVSQRRAARLVLLARSTANYIPVPRSDDASKMRMRDIAAVGSDMALDVS